MCRELSSQLLQIWSMMSTPGSLSEFSSTGKDLAIWRLPTTLCSGGRGPVRQYTEQLKVEPAPNFQLGGGGNTETCSGAADGRQEWCFHSQACPACWTKAGNVSLKMEVDFDSSRRWKSESSAGVVGCCSRWEKLWKATLLAVSTEILCLKRCIN